jgi:nucleotide-binding universal stress UspA family protein
MRIFVATDLSPSADEALRRGHERALLLQAELVVCYVQPALPAADPFFPDWNSARVSVSDELKDRSITALAERVEEITGRRPDEFRLVVGDGGPASTIVRKAEEVGAAIVIVGASGHSGLQRLVLGSVAERVIRFAHGSVLVARPHRESGRILVATDLSDPAVPAIAAAAEEARITRKPLTILHCVEALWPLSAYAGLGMIAIPPPSYYDAMRDLRNEVEQKLRAALQEHSVDGDVRVEEGPPGPTIVSVAENLATDLVVVGGTGRTGISRMTLGSVAETVARTAHCSVLVVRKS